MEMNIVAGSKTEKNMITTNEVFTKTESSTIELLQSIDEKLDILLSKQNESTEA